MRAPRHAPSSEVFTGHCSLSGFSASAGQGIWVPVLSDPCCDLAGVDRHSRPEFLYFWFYFVIVNGIWIVVPLLCIVYACTRISSAVSA